MREDARAEIAWKEETRKLLEVELGGRVCDAMRPPRVLSANLIVSPNPRPVYGPVKFSEVDDVKERIFYTQDAQEPPTEDSGATV